MGYGRKASDYLLVILILGETHVGGIYVGTHHGEMIKHCTCNRMRSTFRRLQRKDVPVPKFAVVCGISSARSMFEFHVALVEMVTFRPCVSEVIAGFLKEGLRLR